MPLRGKITKWTDDRGFGFIKPLRGGDELFVHITAFSNRSRRPIANEFVTYEIGSDERGRLQAEHVKFLGDESSSPAQGWTIAFTIALLFLSFVAMAVFIGRLPFVVIEIYVITSVISFLVYAHDKSAAQQNQRRTPEITMHFLGVIGGWPGAFIAQQWFRHKSKKRSFQQAFWATVVLNCIGLAGMFFV